MFTIRLQRVDIAMADSPRDETWDVAENIEVGELAQLVVDRLFLSVSSGGIRWTMGSGDPSQAGKPVFALIVYAASLPRADTETTVHELEPGGLDRRVIELPIVDRHGVATVWFLPSWSTPAPPRLG